MVKVISHRADVVDRLQAAFAYTADQYDKKMTEVIDSPRLWPGDWGTTFRKNGEVVSGGYRNIVDLSNLKTSQDFSVNGFTAIYEWDGKGVTPVVIVHEGAALSSGHRIPARRWTHVAAQEMDFADTFISGWQSWRS